MVPCDKILSKAKEIGADFIGLSGLITPSLDEMISVAKEMERQQMKTPLLIGGATTSAAHTAIKIAPHYSGSVIHVLDASRSVPVVTSLMGKDKRDVFISDNEIRHDELRQKYGSGEVKNKLLSIEEATNNALLSNWHQIDVPQPSRTGVQEVFPEIKELIPYIDWSPFFHAWEIRQICKKKKTQNQTCLKKNKNQKTLPLHALLLRKRFQSKLPHSL